MGEMVAPPRNLPSAGNVLETDRLRLRRLSPELDAEFILELLNEPSFLRHIGDRGVRSVEDARHYMLEGPVASYARFGFGLNAVVLRDSGGAIGICGLLKRDTLSDPDLGFAFLPAYWSCGYATESASVVLAHAAQALDLHRVVAITSADNERSVRLLQKLGFVFERLVEVFDDEPPVRLYARHAEPGVAPT